MVHQFFDFGTPNFERLDKKIRFEIFREVERNKINGLIFTFVWAFNEAADEAYVDEIIHVFKDKPAKVYFVELDCPEEERLKRNKGENRLKHKPSKRDIEASDARLLHHDKKHRMNYTKGEFPQKSIFKIQNANLTAHEVALKIQEHFEL